MNDNKNKTLVVNLYGAPGAGKSSGAAYIFYKLKKAGINCELVTEFAKDKVWEGSKAVFEDGCYIFGKQHFRMNRLMGKVEVVITDSPLLIAAYYGKEFKEELTAMAKRSFNRWQKSYFINRVKKYNPKGRFQTEEESDKVAEEMEKFLSDNGVSVIKTNGDEKGYDWIVENILFSLEWENATEEVKEESPLLPNESPEQEKTETENENPIEEELLTEEVAERLVDYVADFKARGYGEVTRSNKLREITDRDVYIQDGWLFVNGYSIKIGKGDAFVTFFNDGFSIDMGAHNGLVKSNHLNPETGEWEWLTQWSFTIWEGRTTYKTYILDEKEQIARLQKNHNHLLIVKRNGDETESFSTNFDSSSVIGTDFDSSSVIGDSFYFILDREIVHTISIKDIQSSRYLVDGKTIFKMKDGSELFVW